MTREDPVPSSHRQVIVIGSGFGGTMAAWPLVRAGVEVLMLERGPWVDRGPHCWLPEGTLTRTPFYEDGTNGSALTDRGVQEAPTCACVGGPSVFYGGVSLRFREADFGPNPEIVGDSGARWPVTYHDLRPYYRQAEQILGVAGRAGEDPCEPPRDGDYPARPNGLSPVSERMAQAARSLGLRPFRLPLAINFSTNGKGRARCVECETCDTFACAVEAKNDLATRVLRGLVVNGLDLWAETAVTRIHAEGRKMLGVTCVHRGTGETRTVSADTVILAAGAVGSAHLLLASGLPHRNPAGEVVGRYLTRHCSAIVFGAYRWLTRYAGQFHKQIGLNDYYLGDPEGRGPTGKLGNIQQTQTPAVGTVVGETGAVVGALLTPLVRRATGLLVIAEDRPRRENRVYLDDTPANEGDSLPGLRIEHRYHERDREARAFLLDRAKDVHRAAGARARYVHEINTFSHALGTVRMGDDASSAPLDADCRFRGVDNLYVTDGSALPTSGGVNPSLTIAANALRVGTLLARRAARSQSLRPGSR